jgi:integrase
MIELSPSFLKWSEQASLKLPPLPRLVRYYDNYSDSYTELKDLTDNDVWTIYFDGQDSYLEFMDFPLSLAYLLKSWCGASLPAYSPRTIDLYMKMLNLYMTPELLDVISAGPLELHSNWSTILGIGTPYSVFPPLSNILHFLCEYSVEPWAPEWDDLITLQPYPKRDKYASVRIGDVFITPEEEQSYVKYLDSVVSRIKDQPEGLTVAELRDAAIFLISYQFGMRSKQIAMLRTHDVRIWEDDLDPTQAVHLTFYTIKQINRGKVLPLRRKVKRDWSSIFVEYRKRADNAGRTLAVHFFDVTPVEVSHTILRVTTRLGEPRCATELRHSFAQRLVDAGATEVELAEEMGHSHLDTGLVYFIYSRSMAARVNEALGISQIYNTVLRFAHEPFISPEELSKLKGELQIGGTPHGIPIAGIGGCKSGQPNCPYNPVLSCYGCHRFMPVAEREIHIRVLEDIRGLLSYILSSSYAENGSAAFQLKATIENIQSVISELTGSRNELES